MTNSTIPNDKEYYVKQRLLLLNEIHNILPQSKDVIETTLDSYSLNYGLVRPLLREIYLEGRDALPCLIDYFDNKNYLYSDRYIFKVADYLLPLEETVRKVTLGNESMSLFKAIIDPTNANYKMREGKDGKLHTRPSFFFYKLHDKKIKIEDWLQNKSLREIQQDVVDFYIQHEKDVGFGNKEDEQTYLVPLLEMRKKLPVIKQNFLNNPTAIPQIQKQTKKNNN